MQPHHQRLKVAQYSRRTRNLGISTGRDAIPYAPHILPTENIEKIRLKQWNHTTMTSYVRASPTPLKIALCMSMVLSCDHLQRESQAIKAANRESS
jgi:hypothetical protein